MYLLKSIIISTIIYLFYKLFLQKETFFQSIRWYFITGMVISLLLPLLIIPIYLEVAPVTGSELVEVAVNKELPDFTGITIEKEIVKPIDWLFWLKSIYLIGVAFFLLKFMVELFSLMRLISISKKHKKNRYYLVETNTAVSPFSFFNYIVYNKEYFKESELKKIIEHEKVHVSQKHSIDIILAQLFVVFQWFNPFAWLYKKDLQQNLEYIADYIAQNKAETHKKYQYLLLKTSIKNNSFALSNNFFNSQLKKRIIMLQKRQTKKLNQLKYALLLPFIALFMYSFNTKEVFIQRENNKLKTEIYKDYNNKDSLAFIQPIETKNLTRMASGYGMRMHPILRIKKMHKGLDFSAKEGVAVLVSASGNVVKARYDKNYGNVVYINHENGYQTRYAHLSKVLVEKGTQVVQGEVIGIIGSTGKSVTPHLHFEIIKDGKNVNPMDYLSSFKLQNKSKKTKPHIFKKTSSINNKVNLVKNSTPKQKPILYKKSKDENINNLKSYNKTNKTENKKQIIENAKFKEKQSEKKRYKLDTIQKITKPKENSGWISFENKTYFYSIEKNKISFYTRYGDDVVYNISLELLNKINIEQKTNLELEQKELGFIKYNDKTYFYYNKGSLLFYDKFGEPVKNELVKKLSILLKDKPE